MPKAKTIAQFCLHRFLETHFDLEAVRITAADDGVILEDSAGGRALFQYQEGAVVMQVIRSPDGTPSGQSVSLSFAVNPDKTVRRSYLTLQQIAELPAALFSHYMTYPIPTDEEVRRLAQAGRVSGTDYMSILLWYLAGNYEQHYLGLGGVDSEGYYIDLIFHYRTLRAEHILSGRCTAVLTRLCFTRAETPSLHLPLGTFWYWLVKKMHFGYNKVLYSGRKDGTIMTKAELIAGMASESGLTKTDAEKALNAFLSQVEQALKQGEKVQLVGFGSFEVKERAERIGRNPKTKEAIVIPAGRAPVFKAGTALKDAIK